MSNAKLFLRNIMGLFKYLIVRRIRYQNLCELSVQTESIIVDSSSGIFGKHINRQYLGRLVKVEGRVVTAKLLRNLTLVTLAVLNYRKILNRPSW